jgi:predicted metal-dependent peptidase
MKTPNKLIRYLAIPRGLNSVYGHILQQAQLKIDNGFPAAAGVTVTPNGVMQLFWNAKILSKEPPQYLVLVLIHEAAHLAFCHIPRMLRVLAPYADSRDKKTYLKIARIAADFSVNTTAVSPMFYHAPYVGSLYPDRIKESWMFPAKYKLQDGKSFEWYFNELLKIKESTNTQKLEDMFSAFSSQEGESGEGGEGPGGIGDDVDIEGILEEGAATITRTIRMAETVSEQIIKNAIKATTQNRGTIPFEMSQALEYLQTPPKVSWSTILNDYIRTEISAAIKESTLNPNVGLLHLIPHGLEPYPGYNLDLTFRIAVLMDSSGSVSGDQYKMFLNTLGNILDAEKNIRLHYVVFDAKIHEELLFTTENSEDLRKHNLLKRPACGGTDFLPPFKAAFGVAEPHDYAHYKEFTSINSRKKPDLTIIFTDCYAPLTDPSGPYPKYTNDYLKTIWVVPPHYDKEVEKIATRIVRV